MKRYALVIILSLTAFGAGAQDFRNQTLDKAVVSARVPKRLRNFYPWWGVPSHNSGIREKTEITDTYIVCRADSLSTGSWVCWNLDLATAGEERFKAVESLFPKDWRPECWSAICEAVNECYRWAWRKPYGNTNVVCGRMPYGWYVAVCKKETAKRPGATGFSSIAFMIEEEATPGRKIYDCSTSVNVIEYHIPYNLFPKLPLSVQEIVENMTGYELFCPIQEIDDYILEMLEVEFDSETPPDYDDPRN